MNPRRGRIGIGVPASAATSPAQVPAALTTHGARSSGPCAVGAHADDRAAASRMNPVTVVAAWTSAPATGRAGGGCAVASIGWTCASCGYHAPPATSRRQVRLELEQPGGVDVVDDHAGRPLVRGEPRERREPASASRATTTPPLGSYSSGAAPRSSASSRHSRADSSASSSSGPGSLSLTRMLPSPPLVVPPAIAPALDDGDPQPRPREGVRARGTDDPCADDDDVRGGADHGSIMSHCTDAVGRLPPPEEIRHPWSPSSAPSTRAPARRSRTSPPRAPRRRRAAVERPSRPRPGWPRSGSRVRARLLEAMADALEEEREALVDMRIARLRSAGRASPGSSTARSTSCGSSRA